MTNENKSDFKSYYPRVNVTDYLSESGKKILHDSMVREHEYAEALRSEAAVKYCKLWFPFNPNFGVTEKQTYRKETIMPTVKTVEVNFTFAYVDKRRKYTSKDFGLKSIPYGESNETEADGLPAYQEELEHIKDVLCKTAERFSLDKDCTRITKMSLSDAWISLYNRDEKDNKLDVEIEVSVNAVFDLQFKKPSKNENKEANVIDGHLFCVLNEFSVLAHGHAMCNYWSYE